MDYYIIYWIVLLLWRNNTEVPETHIVKKP